MVVSHLPESILKISHANLGDFVLRYKFKINPNIFPLITDILLILIVALTENAQSKKCGHPGHLLHVCAAMFFATRII